MTMMAMYAGKLYGSEQMNSALHEVPLSVNDYLKQNIRTVPDWPVTGVQFRDITPLLQNPRVFRVLIDAFVHNSTSTQKN